MISRLFLIFSVIFVFSFGVNNALADNSEFVTIISSDLRSSVITSPLNVESVRVNPQVLNQTNMNISVFDKIIKVTHEKTIHRAENDFTYIGSTNGSYNNVWIAYYDGDVRLELTLPENNYVLEPNENDHIITEYDVLGFGESNEGSDASLNPDYQTIVNNTPVGEFTSDDYLDLVIDVIFLYTDESVDRKGQSGIRLMGNLGIDKTNNSFIHAGIPVHLRHVETSTVDTNYVESGIMKTELQRLITPNDGYMERGLAVRNNENIDIGFLFIDKVSSNNLCGRVNQILADPNNAFLAINVNCIEPIGSVITHEFGHLAGARHDDLTHPYQNNPFSYGHGYIDTENNLSTIMAYPCPNCEWQNVWSDPGNDFERSNIVSGTVLREDNSRVLTQVTPYLASLDFMRNRL